MRIRRLYCEDFQPFGTMDLSFPPVESPTRGGEVHLLCGVNGTGKTRILAALAAVFGNPKPLQARLPEKAHRFLIHTEEAPQRANHNCQIDDDPAFGFAAGANSFTWMVKPPAWNTIPAYAHAGEAYLKSPPVKGVMESVEVPHREIALAFSKPEQGNLSQALYNLTIMAANGIRTYGSLEAAERESRPLRLINRIEQMLGHLTRRKVSFEPVPTPSTRLLVRWGSGDPLPFDLLPDGLRSVLGWIVELAVMMDLHYPNETEPWEQPLILLLDEVERHLHPAWQRQVLPIAQELFPKAQFFVATHSPFVISSLNEGWIHPLTLNDDGSVTAEPPLRASEGDSYVSVMGSIMGVTEIYDPETEDLLSRYRELRQDALSHIPNKREEALALAEEISRRSPELAYMMAKEKKQLEALLVEPAEAVAS